MDSNLTYTVLVLAIALLLLSFLIYWYLKNRKDPLGPERIMGILPLDVVKKSNADPTCKDLYESLSKQTYK